MTHDELLAKLDLYEADYFDYPNKELLAVRAVVELHKPYEDHVVYCKDCERIYPCTTIQAIEKELQ